MSPALAGLLSKNPELKYLAQRAFVTYLRSIHLRPDKEMFDVMKLPHAEFAASLGLPSTPRIRFLKGDAAKKAKNAQRSSESFLMGDLDVINNFEDKVAHEDDDVDAEVTDGHVVTAESGNEDVVKVAHKRSKLDRLFKRKNADVLSETFEKMRAHEPVEEDEFIVKSNGDGNRKGRDQKIRADDEVSRGDGAAVKRFANPCFAVV